MAILSNQNSPLRGILSQLELTAERSASLPSRSRFRSGISTVTMPDGNEVPVAGPYSAKALELVARGRQEKITPKIAAKAVHENPAIINQLPDSAITTKLLAQVLKDHPESGSAAVLQSSTSKLSSLIDQGSLTAQHVVEAFNNTVLPTPESFNSFCARVAPLLGKFNDHERGLIREAAENRQKLSEEFWARANEAIRSQG